MFIYLDVELTKKSAFSFKFSLKNLGFTFPNILRVYNMAILLLNFNSDDIPASLPWTDSANPKRQTSNAGSPAKCRAFSPPPPPRSPPNNHPRTPRTPAPPACPSRPCTSRCPPSASTSRPSRNCGRRRPRTTTSSTCTTKSPRRSRASRPV